MWDRYQVIYESMKEWMDFIDLERDRLYLADKGGMDAKDHREEVREFL